ncbi:MAG: SDR family NAD(P)-dependent oxidoreductase [Bradymonadaceae bacterium]|nr:SDR family NAD(P)-dependent oxidoreductase [Lujinxingiaceae bacterium]
MKKLVARTAVVTGAAHGIGRATALALAEAGCALALVDLDEQGLSEVQALVEGVGREAKTYRVDVSNAGQMDALARDVVEDFGGVHIVVNNAGISVTGRFEEHTSEDFERVMGVNFGGVLNGCRVFLPHLRRADEAHLVNISSVFGIVGVAGQSAYCASKFAVRGLSETLHEELAHTRVGVSVVHPGCIQTNIVKSSTFYDDQTQPKALDYFARYGVSPGLVARRIVRAIRNNEHRVLVTREAFLLDWMRRVAPESGNRVANRIMQRMLGIKLEDVM